MSRDADLEDELLRRFQALKSTPTDQPGAAGSFRSVTDEQARKAREEDEELGRIADGRPPVVDVKERRSEEDDLARRVASLRGVEHDETAGEDDDADVSFTVLIKAE